MPNRRKDKLRQQINKRLQDSDKPTLQKVAEELGLKGRQWVWYYKNKSKND